jgi:hypothetical protein
MEYIKRLVADAELVGASVAKHREDSEKIIKFTEAQLKEFVGMQFEHQKQLQDHRRINWKPYDPDCYCGCNKPTFTEPMEALEFLAGRMEFAGIGSAVADSYARDIRKILHKEDAKLTAIKIGIRHNIADFENFKFLGGMPGDVIDIILNRNKRLLETLIKNHE